MDYKSKVFQNKDKINKLLKLAGSSVYSAPRLAKIFRCNKKTIFKALSVNKIILPNLGRFKKRVHVNDSFFNKDTLNPISAYWAGFIAADGTLFRDKEIGISLSRKDVKHIYKFKKAIRSNARVGHIKSNNSVRVGIYSREVFNSLVQLGITPNKSLTISHVGLPPVLMPHFIRGVFDGDGWVSGNRVTHVQFGIAGNKPFLQQIQGVLIKNCHINKVQLYPLSRLGGAYKLQYTGTQIFRIIDFLYKGSDRQTRLERKYKQALDLKNKFSTQHRS